MTQVLPSKPLTHFKLCSFDIYGTLINWEGEGGIASAMIVSKPIASLPANHPLKSHQYLSETFHGEQRALQEEQPSLEYSKLVAKVYKRMLSTQKVRTTPDELDSAAATFADSIGTWPAFPDTVAAMQVLKKYFRLVPLSNVDRASFSRTLSGPLKGVEFDAVYTAQDVGSYKPAYRNFDYLIEHVETDFGIKKDEIWHVAQSLYHDHVPTTEMGFETGVWVDRRGVVVSEKLKEEAKYGWKVKSLGELAKIVEEAFVEKN